MTMEICLRAINMCLCWIFLTIVTLWAECCCGTLSLRWPFFAKILGYFAKVLSFCMKMPGVIHPTGQLFMAVHLIGYGSVPILHSLFSLSLHPWEAPGWQVIATDADMKQVITSWLQTLDNSVLTLEYKPWYQCGANAEMVVVTTLKSDVYHLHMCHVLITVTLNILTWECLLPYFLKVFGICIAVWAGEFIDIGCSERWGFCVTCYFDNELFVITSDFHHAMPTQFCNLPYKSIIYWKLQLFCLKIFSYILYFSILYC